MYASHGYRLILLFPLFIAVVSLFSARKVFLYFRCGYRSLLFAEAKLNRNYHTDKGVKQTRFVRPFFGWMENVQNVRF